MALLFVPLIARLAPAQSRDANPVFAFVVDSWIQMSVGTYLRHEKRWVSSDAAYVPYQPEETVTLFDLTGKAAEVRVKADRRPDPSGVSRGWMAPVEKWVPTPGSEPYALAVNGQRPPPNDAPRAIPLDDPLALQAMRHVLKAGGIPVDNPRMTQALRLDITPDATDYLLFLSASSEPNTLRDGVPGARYTASVLERHVRGRDSFFILERQLSVKPAHQSVAEHEHFYGTAEQDRFVAFVDLDGDGHNELVLYVARAHGLTVDVFTFDGRKPRRVISVDKQTDL